MELEFTEGYLSLTLITIKQSTLLCVICQGLSYVCMLCIYVSRNHLPCPHPTIPSHFYLLTFPSLGFFMLGRTPYICMLCYALFHFLAVLLFIAFLFALSFCDFIIHWGFFWSYYFASLFTFADCAYNSLPLFFPVLLTLFLRRRCRLQCLVTCSIASSTEIFSKSSEETLENLLSSSVIGCLKD
ncbi:hypothetical protein C8Q75DRAFT_74877 [Abortiporus biennis]|nr:hypothetical protein C8Q75DRAFT_74877 [Abortiporus biennis]